MGRGTTTTRNQWVTEFRSLRPPQALGSADRQGGQSLELPGSPPGRENAPGILEAGDAGQREVRRRRGDHGDAGGEDQNAGSSAIWCWPE